MLTSRRPYLVRAIYEWIADNDLTPYLLVDTAMDGVFVPRHAVQNDRIVLNISVQAVDQLQLGNQEITFDARFAGRVENIHVPIKAILAIYARENGVGLAFNPDNDDVPAETEGGNPVVPVGADPSRIDPVKPGLRLVK
jgi:stringent starvation protein B